MPARQRFGAIHRNEGAGVHGVLRAAIFDVLKSRPFKIDAWVLLPDYLHCIWTLWNAPYRVGHPPVLHVVQDDQSATLAYKPRLYQSINAAHASVQATFQK